DLHIGEALAGPLGGGVGAGGEGGEREGREEVAQVRHRLGRTGLGVVRQRPGSSIGGVGNEGKGLAYSRVRPRASRRSPRRPPAPPRGAPRRRAPRRAKSGARRVPPRAFAPS